jgi:arylsulfatase A
MIYQKTIITSYLNLIGAIPVVLAGSQKGTEEKKPNIIIFLVDDLGWSDLGCYGSRFYETPNIDRFASENMVFTSAYAACHVSSPTRASILTGKYPATLNLTDWLPGRKEFPFQKLSNVKINQNLPYEEITVAEALKEHGYATAIYGKWHLGEDPSNPMHHGFDIHVPDWAKGWPNGSYYYPFKLKGLEGKEGDYLTDRLTDEALKFIDQNSKNPFFLYFAHFAVHDPINGRPDLVKKYQEKLKRMPRQEGPPFILEGNPDSPHMITLEEAKLQLGDSAYLGYSQLSDRMVKIKQYQDNAQFGAMIESVDESFGRVIDKLNELGIDENTIVIFFSDNGGMAAANFGNPWREITEDMLDIAFSTSNVPLRGAKGWLYEGGIRVPMIVRWPGNVNTKGKCDVPVISVDLYPTILDMLGYKLPDAQKVDGISIVPLLEGKKKLNRDAIYWHFPHYSNHGMQSPGGAIRCGDYKLIEYFENGTVQLFNLKDDIGEQHDLATAHPKMVKKLKKKLHDWRISINAHMMEPNPDYVPTD